MSPDDSFIGLMARLRAGGDEAAAAVFRRFANRLIGLARTHLDARMRAKVDPEDVIQSVYRSFFVRHAEGQLELESWDGLWSLLTVMTVRKCGRHREKFFAARRDLRREDRGEGATDHLTPRHPGPEEAAALADLLETLLAGLDERPRLVVSMRLQGHTLEEIAAACGVTDRTVSNILAQLRERLGRLIPEEE
jgi:RNA polymerase sigma-70 factor (ECF subfamily)